MAPALFGGGVMRKGFVMLGLVLLAGGCATAPAERSSSVTYTDRAGGAAAPAAALVFDPPVTAYGPLLDLSREGRDEAAYLGYDEGVTTFYYVRQDDRQGDFWSPWGRRFGNSGGDFEREAVSVTAGVRYR